MCTNASVESYIIEGGKEISKSPNPNQRSSILIYNQTVEISRLISYSTLPPSISKNANATYVLIIWTSHQLVLSLLVLALLSLGQKPKQKDQL